MTLEHFDVLIVGAGISGIGAGYHLQTRCPCRSYAILEGRECLGGTWDLFRYPGIRSDSDMYTLGYSFRPWTSPKAIADGPAILAYLNAPRTSPGPHPCDQHRSQQAAPADPGADRKSRTAIHGGLCKEATRDLYNLNGREILWTNGFPSTGCSVGMSRSPRMPRRLKNSMLNSLARSWRICRLRIQRTAL